MFHLFLVHGGHQVELAQVFPEEAMHHRHIFLGHRPQTRSLWSLMRGRRRDRMSRVAPSPLMVRALSLTSGRRYNFMVRCIVMFLLKWENLTSISLRGFKERCQYLREDVPLVKLSIPGYFCPVLPTCRCPQAWAGPPQQCRPPGRFPGGSPVL